MLLLNGWRCEHYSIKQSKDMALAGCEPVPRTSELGVYYREKDDFQVHGQSSSLTWTPIRSGSIEILKWKSTHLQDSGRLTPTSEDVHLSKVEQYESVGCLTVEMHLQYAAYPFESLQLPKVTALLSSMSQIQQKCELDWNIYNGPTRVMSAGE